MKKISVSVPSYKRPEMMHQLIKSFLHQDYENKELVISDDTPDDSVKNVVESYQKQHPSVDIKFFHNTPNLGYSQNFWKSIQRSTGDYVVTLGDDDCFLSNNALSKYVEVFDNNPNVGYVYSNQVQFSNDLNIDSIVRFVTKDTLFAKGEESYVHMWTTSIFIPGIGLRKDILKDDFYPQEHWLFPQLELVGHIIAQYDSFCIADVLIAGRAHEEQLGFHAIKGERIKGEEKHGNIELFQIFSKLQKSYHFSFDQLFLEQLLTNRYITSILKERLIVGKTLMRENYKNFCKESLYANNNKTLKCSYVLANILPTSVLWGIRRVYITINYLKERKLFQNLEQQLISIIK